MKAKFLLPAAALLWLAVPLLCGADPLEPQALFVEPDMARMNADRQHVDVSAGGNYHCRVE